MKNHNATHSKCVLRIYNKYNSNFYGNALMPLTISIHAFIKPTRFFPSASISFGNTCDRHTFCKNFETSKNKCVIINCYPTLSELTSPLWTEEGEFRQLEQPTNWAAYTWARPNDSGRSLPALSKREWLSSTHSVKRRPLGCLELLIHLCAPLTWWVLSLSLSGKTGTP